MARFARCAEVLLGLNGAMIGLFIFGPGLAMPSQTSLSPPSVCIAQAPVYQAIGKLQVFIVPLIPLSILLAGVGKVEVGDEAITGMQLLFRRFLRGCMVLAVLLSAVTLGLGLLTWAYVLEAKVSVFSCLSLSLRFSFFATYTVATVVSTLVFARFAWIVVFYE